MQEKRATIKRDKVVKLFLSLFLFIGSLSPLQANQYCHCISATTSPAPNNQLMYIASCYRSGQQQPTLLTSTTVASQAEADAMTAKIMQTYNIKENDCVKRPDGTMVLVPKAKGAKN